VPDPRPDVSVLSSGHDVADARLHREVDALRRAGLRVEVLGLGVAAAGPPGALVRTAPRRGPAGRAARSVALPMRARGRLLLTLDPDLVPAAWLAARVLRRPLVVDVHEDYAALLADRAWARGALGLLGVGARAVVGTSTALAGRADLTLVADDQVPPGRARQRLVLRNLPDLRMLPAPSPRDGLRALYVGDLRASRGLFTMVDAVAAAPGWSVDLVGPVAAADESRLRGVLAADPGTGERVRLHGRLPPRRAWELAAGAAAGLVLLESTPAFAASMPTKLYEYLACGLAVLASPLPRQAALVQAAGAGVVVADAAAAAAALRVWSADPSALDACRDAAAGWAAANLHGRSGYDELADRVVALLAAGRRPPDRPTPVPR
jgi:glycosyltransferase involved in cell wall biosynthesis